MAQEKKPPDDQKAPELVATDAIPLGQIAMRAAEVPNLLHSLRTHYATGTDVERLKKEIDEVKDKTASEQQRTIKVLESQPSLERLKTEAQSWQKFQAEVVRRLDLLTRMATQLKDWLGKLADLQKLWGQQTLDAARAGEAPDTIMQQISTVIAAIDAEVTTVQSERSVIIGLQGELAANLAICETMLAEIAKASQTKAEGAAGRQVLPIWSSELWAGLRSEGWGRIKELTEARWEDLRNYWRDPSMGLPIHIGFFAVLAGFFYALERQVGRWTVAEGSPGISSFITGAPLVLALTGALLLATSPFSATPPSVRSHLSILTLAATILLMRPSLTPRGVSVISLLGLLFAIDTARQALAGATLFDHLVILVEALAGMALLVWVMHGGGLRAQFARSAEKDGPSIVRAAEMATLFIFGAGLIAGIMGYLRFARLAVSGVLLGYALAIELFVAIQIVTGVVGFSLRIRPMRFLQMVSNHREAFERISHRVLIGLAILGWTARMLDYLDMQQSALSLGKAMFSLKLERGAFNLSLADVIAFALALWLTYLLSAFIRFALREDVYPRRKLPQGVAYAASQLIHYLIMTLGTVVALGLIGMDLTKVTVLISAFGVGIGFGLQTVVNNFVSGLILLFERPINLGDTIEVNNMLGQVRRIGLRSSIVRTLQGADIVVPNAHLVAEQVTNWTFSDQTRRIDLPVGVNYNAKPQKVIEIIASAARAHPGVLKKPPPQVLLVGFGDSAINFELRAWTDKFSDWAQVKSEIAVAVYDVIRASGFSFPFPQREVRLLDNAPP
jgi:small-conductance mechanosensitive channel